MMQLNGLKLKNFICFFVTLLLICLVATPVLAKKKKDKKETTNQTQQISAVEQRINSLNGEDKRRFDSLSKEQQKLIREGKIDRGFNEWMVELAFGKPYYGTEHHPVFVDYEQVWLYTKNRINETKQEKQITDPQTNWPTIHRISTIEICQIGDFFVLWDRGVVVKTTKDTSGKTYGTCTLRTQEAFLPIVNGKVIEPH